MRQNIYCCAFLMLIYFVLLPNASAQFSQQGSKLAGADAVGEAEEGFSVALSADGNTAIVGGQADSSNVGAVWVFTRSNGVWSQQGSKLLGTGAVANPSVFQGHSVALSADGNTAIVGGYEDNYYVGAAWIFTRSNGTWSQQGGKLVGTGATGYGSEQGTSVSLSADGNTAIVGGPVDSTNYEGAAWVFTRSGSVWSQQGSKLVGTGATGSNSIFQGSSVSLSADGNTAIVGGNGDNTNVGAVWVFTRSDTVWSQQGGKLVGSDAIGTPYQGSTSAISLSADGNTAAVGGSEDSSDVGAVWVFTRSGSVWSQQGSKLVGTAANGTAMQGTSVSISGGGDTIIVGGQEDSTYVGAVWVFTRSGGVWSQQGGKLVGSGATGEYAPRQGCSISLSADSYTAIVGGENDNGGIGSVWVFATPNAPLPVELTSFIASVSNFTTILAWMTTTEVNNAGFDIERQPASTQLWTKIGFVAGAETSNVPHSYSYTDNVGSAGTYSYRLKQIDHDGAFTYSQEVQVTIAVPNVLALSQNFPEPFNPSTTIQFTVPNDGRATLKVYNAIGQEVATLFDAEATAGTNHQVQFNASNLASGVYFSRLEFGGKMQMNKMLLLK